MLETDSLVDIQTYHAPGSNFSTTSDGVTRNTLGMTPLRVINSLKASATEEQKDSAIQANFKPGLITYNQRPDTLSCFGFKPTKHDVFSKPKFMDKEYFPTSKYFHPEKVYHKMASWVTPSLISCATTTPSQHCSWVASL